MQTFYLKHKNIIRTRTNFKLIKISHHSVQGVRLKWNTYLLSVFSLFSQESYGHRTVRIWTHSITPSGRFSKKKRVQSLIRTWIRWKKRLRRPGMKSLWRLWSRQSMIFRSAWRRVLQQMVDISNNSLCFCCYLLCFK